MSDEKTLFGHPRGFTVLFIVEMCERFSSCGIASILILYMVAEVSKGGLGWEKATAFLVLGVFRMFACVTAVPGGLLADRWLGARRCVCIGALLCFSGDFAMALPSSVGFVTGLVLLAIGGGFYKPNITTVLGRLYAPDDPHKEAAFTVFYLAVNIGSLIAGFALGFLAMKFGWRYGFFAAGIVLLLGQLAYLFGQRHLISTDAVVEKSVTKTVSTSLTAAEKRRIGVIVGSFFVVIIFNIAYDQFSGLVSVYIEQFTDRQLGSFTVPTPWFSSLNPFLVIILAPMFAALWTFLAKKRRDPHAIVKMGLGTAILGLAFLFMVAAVIESNTSATHQSSMLWIVLAYFLFTVGELALSPVALSFITSTAPARMTSQIMGWYIAVVGIACFCAAKVGSLAASYGELTVFVALLIVTTLIGVLQIVFSKQILRFTQGETTGIIKEV